MRKRESCFTLILYIEVAFFWKHINPKATSICITHAARDALAHIFARMNRHF